VIDRPSAGGWARLASLVGVAAMTCAAPAAAQQPSAPVAPAQVRAVLDRYCASCHNARVRTADFALDDLDLANPRANGELWETVIRKLRVGLMPPVNVQRPDEAIYDRLVSWLEATVDAAPGATARPGQPLLRRLNRAEYGNAIRDLLGFEVDVATLLPPDDSAYGFDNVADVLGSSPAQFRAYLTAARRISALAVGDPLVPPGGTTYTVRQDLSQDRHLEGLPLGTFGGLRARHVFPVDGEYDIQIRLFRTNLSAIRGLEDPHQLELTLDGRRILLSPLGGDEDLIALQANPTDASDALEADRLRVRAFVEAGQRDLTAAFLEETPSIFDTTRLQPFIRDFNPYDAEGAPHVQSITVQGPFEASSASPRPPGSRLFVCRPTGAADEAPCARRILSTIARRAYRRPVGEDEIGKLLAFYEEGRADGGFASGIQFGLRRVLASPSFVFRPEVEPSDVAPGVPYPVTDVELASRLSFFLWSSIPDDELLALADEGRLVRPEVLAGQVRRMIADERAEAFVRNFAGQWLHLRNLPGIVPNSEIFPDFDDNLRQAFRREAELFFASVVREDRSVLDLMLADDTFVNERLARHYGIPGVFGSDFRRVRLPDDARRGLLGKGAVLLATSHPTATSPVLRGKWILENVLGAPPPPPPADLDTALKPEAPGAEPRTRREQIEAHRENPVCARCHQVIDPIGFALESFDATGAWRATNDVGTPLDTTAVLFDGTPVDGVGELRRALVRRPEIFVQTLTEKLLIYALGRGLTYEDMPIVRRIVAQARSSDYRFSALLEGIVESAPFRMRVKPASGEAPVRVAGDQREDDAGGGRVTSRR